MRVENPAVGEACVNGAVMLLEGFDAFCDSSRLPWSPEPASSIVCRQPDSTISCGYYRSSIGSDNRGVDLAAVVRNRSGYGCPKRSAAIYVIEQ